MTHYSIEPRTRKYVKRYGFFHSWKIYSKKTVTKKKPATKTVFKKVVHKTAKRTGESIGNKFADKIVKPKSIYEMNSRNFEEIVTPPEKREELLNQLKQAL